MESFPTQSECDIITKGLLLVSKKKKNNLKIHIIVNVDHINLVASIKLYRFVLNAPTYSLQSFFYLAVKVVNI